MFYGKMVIEVIAREICKYTDVESQCAHSFLRQRVRRCLQGHRPDTGPAHLGEHLLQIDRLWSGVMRWELTPLITIIDRSYDARLETGSLQDGLDKIRECGLAVGPSYPDKR